MYERQQKLGAAAFVNPEARGRRGAGIRGERPAFAVHEVGAAEGPLVLKQRPAFAAHEVGACIFVIFSKVKTCV